MKATGHARACARHFEYVAVYMYVHVTRAVGPRWQLRRDVRAFFTSRACARSPHASAALESSACAPRASVLQVQLGKPDPEQ